MNRNLFQDEPCTGEKQFLNAQMIRFKPLNLENDSMDISSTVFSDMDEIPEKYGYREENTNPPVKFSEIPENAESLVLVVDDPDAVEPAGKIWTHWLMYNIPVETTEIGEGEKPIGAEEGKNDYGDREYGGPNPPDREHTYRFKLYALDEELDLNQPVKKQGLEQAMEEHIIEKAKLRGTYEPT